MSITASAPATSTTGADPTVTAEIEVIGNGAAHLLVTVDGERVRIEINRHLTRLYQQTDTEEATRLLRRHAGYEPTSAWTIGEHGHLTATVAEISGRCVTCVHGCGCEIGSTGCAHYQCLAATAEVANTCDGAALALDAKRPSYRRRPRRHASR
jgi:hypothetical protein